MKIHIDLENPKKTIAEIQAAVNDLIVIKDQALKAGEDANILTNKYRVLSETLQKNVEDLDTTLKTIFNVLMIKKPLWEKDEEMNELMTSMAHYVTSSGAIKLAVMKDKK